MDDLRTLKRIMGERRSIRRFQNRPVERKIVDEALHAASLAPSAGNRQQYRFWVITRRTLVEAMGRAVAETISQIRSGAREDLKSDLDDYLANFLHFVEAPVVIASIYRKGGDLIGHRGVGGGIASTDRSVVDAICSVAAATENLLLALHAAQLGACWMTGPLIAAKKLEAILEVPAGWALAAIIPLGYPDERPEAPPRRSMDNLVRFLT